MEFIVDTNILFTFFWEKSFTKGILFDQDFKFFSPEYAIEEINAHSEEIMEKTGISLDKFKKLRKDIAICVEFFSEEKYSDFLKEAALLLPSHQDDIDFLALALKLNLPIWSNDSHLKSQDRIKVYTTKEFINLIQ